MTAMTDQRNVEPEYCEGCESEGVELNAKGYCDTCVRVARASGNAESVE